MFHSRPVLLAEWIEVIVLSHFQFSSHDLSRFLESACESEDELSPDWEEISPTDERLQEYNDHFCTSTATLVHSEKDSLTEAKQSSQLSAEAVAKSLLQKFASRRHPAACELHWLVSFQDAPQRLLPMPQTVAVAPDDVPKVDSDKKKSVSRRNSLPVSSTI